MWQPSEGINDSPRVLHVKWVYWWFAGKLLKWHLFTEELCGWCGSTKCQAEHLWTNNCAVPSAVIVSSVRREKSFHCGCYWSTLKVALAEWHKMGTDPVLTSSLHLLSTCGSLEAVAWMWESGGYCCAVGICSDPVFKVTWGKPCRFLEWVHLGVHALPGPASGFWPALAVFTSNRRSSQYCIHSVIY